MKLKKILTILLTLAMVMSLLPATAFAANNTATTMRLAKTQGTVTVTNSSGKNVTKTENMKLYNGYQVKTGAKSYAWISLDDTKVAKLDANSALEVQKSGKNLTLFLSSGSMFFNVKDPLPSGENFHIKTSTMTTGIRGTSGCVRVISPRISEIHLLTGKVEVYAEHPGLGLSKSATLVAGQKATSLIDREAVAASGELVEILIEKLENHEICGICSEEIARDPALLERIEREAPHLLPGLAATEAGERLAADEAEAAAKQAQINQAEASQEFPEDVDPYFEETSGGGGGSSSGGSSTPVTPPEDEPVTPPEDEPVTPPEDEPEEQIPAENTISVASWDELADAITKYNNGEMTDTGYPIQQIKLTDNVDGMSANSTLEIADNGPLVLNLDEYTLQMNDTLTNNGNLTITNADGHIIGETGSTVIMNNGTLTLNDGEIRGVGAPAVDNNGAFTMEGGELTFHYDPYGSDFMYALYNRAGKEADIQKGTVSSVVEGEDDNYSNGIYNAGQLNLGKNAKFDKLNTAIENYGTLTQMGAELSDIRGYYIYNYSGFVYIYGGQIDTEDMDVGINNEGISEDEAGIVLAGQIDMRSNRGIYSIGPMSRVTVEDADITVHGDYGIYITNGCTLTFENSTMTVEKGYGIFSEDQTNTDVIYLNSGTIIAEGDATAVLRKLREENAVDQDIEIETENGIQNRYISEDMMLKAEGGPEAVISWKARGYDENGDEYRYDLWRNTHHIEYNSPYYELVSGQAEGNVLGVVYSVDEFLAAVEKHNTTKGDSIITLGAEIDLYAENLVYQEKYNEVLPVVKIIANTGELCIDLAGYTLSMHEPLENNGTLRLKDTASGGWLTGTPDGVIENDGTLYIDSAGIDSFHSENSSATGNVIANTGEIHMTGGYVYAADTANAISDKGGTVNISGDADVTANSGTAVYSDGGIVNISENAEIDVDDGIAVHSTSTGDSVTNELYVRGGKIIVGNLPESYGTGIRFNCGYIGLLGGSVYAGNANTNCLAGIAVDATGFYPAMASVETLLQTNDKDKVYVGLMPEGYCVVEETDAYIPALDNYAHCYTLVEGYDAAGLIAAVQAFDGAEDKTLKLAGPVDIDNDNNNMEKLVMGLNTLSAGGSMGEETLTIDLNGNEMGLDIPLEVNGTLKIDDSSGDGMAVYGSADALLIVTEGSTFEQGDVHINVNEANGIGIRNDGGKVKLYEGELFASGAGSYGVYSTDGHVLLGDADVYAWPEGATDKATGIYLAGGASLNLTTGTLTVRKSSEAVGVEIADGWVNLTGSEVTVYDGTGIFVRGGNAANITLELDEGSITAEDGAKAILVSEDANNNELTVIYDRAEIRATVEENVFDWRNADGDYLWMEDGRRFEQEDEYVLLYLPQQEGGDLPSEPEPVEPAAMVYVEDDGDFIKHLLNFDGSVETKIVFNTNDAMTDEVIAVVEEELGVSIDTADIKVSSGSKSLAIDLNDCNLYIGVDGLENEGTLIIQDNGPNKKGSITGSASQLIYNRGTLDLQGGTIEEASARAVQNVGTMTMSGGTINVTKSEGISLQSGKLTMTGGTINVKDADGLAEYQPAGIYANTDEPLILEGGSIIVTDASAYGIQVSQVGQITLDGTVVKGLNKDNLLTGYYDTDVTVTDQPDNEGYYYLTEVASAEEVDSETVTQRFMEWVLSGASEVKLTDTMNGNVHLTSELLDALGKDYLETNHQNVANHTLTIDLMGHNMTLDASIINNEGTTLTIMDSVGGSVINGSAVDLNGMIINYGTLELQDVDMEVSNEGQVGIFHQGTMFKLTDQATITVLHESAKGVVLNGMAYDISDGSVQALKGTGIMP